MNKITGIVILPLFSCMAMGATTEKKQTPNLLFVFPDQMRAQTLGFLGEEKVRTPVLDRFASQGVYFSNAISNYPVSSPTRAMIMSGQYPHHNKVVGNCTNLTETIAGKARTDIQGGNITTINGYNIFNVLGGHLSNVTGGTTNFTQGAFVSLNIFGNYTYSFPEFLDFSPSHSAIKNHGKAINQIVTEVSDIKTEMANSAKQDIKDSMISNVSHVHFIDTAKKVAKMEQENVTVKVTENNEWTLRTKELNVESDATTINIKGLKGSITTSFLETKRLQLSTEERQELTNRASLVGKWNFI